MFWTICRPLRNASRLRTTSIDDSRICLEGREKQLRSRSRDRAVWTERMRCKGRWPRGFRLAAPLDNAVESAVSTVDHSVMPWISPSIALRSLGSSCSKTWILSTACSTVVWSLPPKARPTSDSEAWVSCRARYIAIWRGKATAFVRFLALRSESLIPYASATLRWICSIVMIFSPSPQSSPSTSCARSTDMSRPVRAQKAIMRVSEPSSSRILDFTRLAMRHATSSARRTRSRAAFFLRMATRVSKSGGWMSAIRPHSKRDRKRSSISGIFFGAESLEGDLFSRLVEVVEGMEEFLLRPLLSGDELNIIDQQEIDRPVACTEVGRVVVADRIDELVGETLRREIGDHHAGEQAATLVTDRVEQVRLAEADTAIDEQR